MRHSSGYAPDDRSHKITYGRLKIGHAGGGVERKLKALVACFGCFLCCATIPVSAEPLPAPLVQFNGYATTEKIGGDFELFGFDSAGEHKVSLRQFRGKYLLLLFGFTHCPISCRRYLLVQHKL
jgi:cytochrome oxidase Cu insertion factor (SCO1/SenC/PrrC family)